MRTFIPHREDGAPPRRRLALSALLTLGIVATSLTAASLALTPQAASAAPGNPGTPSAPTTLYNETFENGMGTDPVLLPNYTGAVGTKYTADQAWLENCNGAVVEFNSPDSALTGPAINNCAPNPSGQNPLYSYSQLRQLAYALGTYAGVDPSTNHAVAAYTAGDPGANRTEIQTVNSIPLNASGRYVSFSVDTAAVNCGVSAPSYDFYLVQSDGTQVFAGSANACTSGQSTTAPAKGNAPAQANISVGTYTSNGAVRVTGNSVGLIMRNANGSGTGNDAAFDNLKILDVTPQMDKSFSPALQRTGDAATLTFTVTNTSELGAKSGWGFTDSLPSGLVLANSTVGGTCDAVTSAPAGGTTIRVANGNLAAGERSCTITVQVTSNTAGTYQNCPTTNVTTVGLDQPACATVQFADPSYTVSKTSDKASAYEGDTVKYTVTVTNTGTVPYSAARPASFTDDLSKVLDDATYNNDASNGASVSGNTLTWSGPLAVGATQTITYSVTVNKPDTGDKVLTNAVAPDKNIGGSCDPDPTKTCTTDTPVQSYTVEKTADQEKLEPGKTITYTVTVKNTGKVDYTADNPASFTDDLSSVTDDATYNGDASNGATVDGNTLSWKGALAQGATQTITYSFTVNDPDTGDKTLKNAVVPTAPGGGCAQEPCSVETPVGTYVIKKTADKASAKEGDTVTWTVSVENTGKADADASFTDDLSKVLDDATYNKDAQASAGTLSYDQPNLSWSGTVPVGQTVTITYSATVNTPDTGDRDLNNVITSPHGCKESGAICETDTPVQQFRVTKTADTSGAQEGDTVTYTVTVENTGKVDYTDADPATFTDDMTKVLDDATYNGDAKASAGTVSYDAPKLNWTGPLAVGDTATVTYTVKVNTPDTGDKSLDNVIVSPGCYPNDPNCEVVVPVASYTVAKQADKTTAKPGDVVHYTVTVTNTGQVAYTTAKPATFTDDLSKVTDDATYNGDASNGATVKGNTLSWSGALGKGQTITVTYSFTVNNPDTGDQKLVNIVDPGAGRCATDGGCTTNTTVTPTPPAPQGPTVATGGTAITGLGVWPMVGAAGSAIAVLLALLTMTVINRRRNGDSA